MIWKTLGAIGKNLVTAIPAMMLAGFAYGMAFDAATLKTLIVPLTFVMVYPMMVNLKIDQVFNTKGAKTQILTQLINFGIIPFVAWGLGAIFFGDQQYMMLGLLLAALLPTSGMTISWTGFAKGNLEAAVKMTVIGLTLGSLATPLYIKGILGTSLAIDMAKVFQQIVMIVFVPMALGYSTRKILVHKIGTEKFKEIVAPKMGSLSSLGVLGIIFVAIALKAPTIAANPMQILFLLIPLTILYLINFALSTVIGKATLPRNDAIALVYGTVMRNLSIALAIAINAFGSEGAQVALIISAAFILQTQMAAWYVKFTDRVFGPAEDKPKEKKESAGKESEEPELVEMR